MNTSLVHKLDRELNKLQHLMDRMSAARASSQVREYELLNEAYWHIDARYQELCKQTNLPWKSE
jgi:hypothetical protein